MKNIKNSVLIRLFCLLSIIFVATIFPMRMPERGKEAAKAYRVRMQQPKKQYFIYQADDKSKGMWVDKDLVETNCKPIKAMIEDFVGELNEIPLNFPIEIIRLVFYVLSDHIDINDLSLTDLISIANAFNFLDVPADKMNLILARIKSDLVDKVNDKNSDEQLKQLHPDLQKALMLDSIINCLKDSIVKKYAKDRKQALVGYPWSVFCVAVSPDGTKILSGCWQNTQDNLILCDISDPSNITPKALAGHPGAVHSVAFSSDGKKIISSCYGNQNNLILWDISDSNNIMPKALVGHPEGVYSVAFSPDGTKIVSGSRGKQNNLIVWDITDPNNITPKALAGHPMTVKSVSFSSDGKYIISSCVGINDNLFLWDVTDINNNIKYNLSDKLPILNSWVAFLPNGKQFVSCGNLLALWDVSDPTNVSHKELGSLYDFNIDSGVSSLALSHDGKQIALGHHNGFTLLDINDPNNRVTVDTSKAVLAIAFSPDDKRIVTGESAFSKNNSESNLNIWTVFTDQERQLLNQVRNYTVDQIRLIYMFCLKASKGEKILLQSDSEEQNIFMTLPEDMQKLLKDLFFA
ncbi:MAG TPA: WD40 repeat domain-containing protein [Candidatus Babeliales bacterium]|nr:WD40 repeat domain-containing protein [Candidatus Babeliales bacterium]